jgi:hypothetical protein
MRGEQSRGTRCRSGCVRDTHLNMQTGGPDHIDQGIEAEQFDLAAHEIGDTRLRNAKQFGGLRLAEPLKRKENALALTLRIVRRTKIDCTDKDN